MVTPQVEMDCHQHPIRLPKRCVWTRMVVVSQSETRNLHRKCRSTTMFLMYVIVLLTKAPLVVRCAWISSSRCISSLWWLCEVGLIPCYWNKKELFPEQVPVPSRSHESTGFLGFCFVCSSFLSFCRSFFFLSFFFPDLRNHTVGTGRGEEKKHSRKKKAKPWQALPPESRELQRPERPSLNQQVKEEKKNTEPREKES